MPPVAGDVDDEPYRAATASPKGRKSQKSGGHTGYARKYATRLLTHLVALPATKIQLRRARECGPVEEAAVTRPGQRALAPTRRTQDTRCNPLPGDRGSRVRALRQSHL